MAKVIQGYQHGAILSRMSAIQYINDSIF